MAAAEKKIMKYDAGAMEQAVDAVKKGMPTKTAAKQFGVPKTTLHYHVTGKYELNKPIGARTFFTPEEEKLLVEWVLDLAKKGFPITKGNFLYSVGQLAKELNVKFKNETPSRKWFEGFMRRHPNVSLRAAQNLTTSRAAVTQQNLHDWFSEVFDYLKANQNEELLKKPEKLFNLDESAFFLNPKENLVLAGKGEKNLYTKSGANEKECVSVLVGGNAAGDLCPPMVIFDYKRVPAEVANSIPKDWGLGISDSGWSTYDVFYCYIANVFHPWVKEHVGLPIILFVDGHISHLSYALSVFCAKNGIILVALYPNATHILQPMDVAVFRTLKKGWREHVNQWKIEHFKPELKKHEFSPVLQTALNERITPQILANGFRKCGLYPWDPTAVNSFFENKENSGTKTPITETPNTSYSLRRTIQCLETYIGSEKVKLFKASQGDTWEGQESDKSLFIVWKNMYSDLLNLNKVTNPAQTKKVTTDPRPSCEVMSLAEMPLQPMIISSAVQASSSKITEPVSAPSNVTPNKGATETPVLPTPIKNSLKSSPSIPTPFKKSLFFPGEDENKVKRKREKIPSVVSSKLWQEYSERKKLKKEQKEKEKNDRKQIREAKKKEKEELMAIRKKELKKGMKKGTKRRLNFDSESDTSEDVNEPECLNSDQDCDMESFSDLGEKTYNINEFVIVFYEGEYFPGQIKDKRQNDDDTGHEYLVSVMAMSGPNGWRWPETEDKIWYVEGQVLERITPPSVTNSRGVCSVPSIMKYRQA